MKYIDHHAHMVSRTTDDYQQMALTGCVAVTEPAFWAGWDRSSATASRTTSASSPIRAEARRAVRHPALHVAGDEPEGIRRPRALARGAEADSEVPRSADRARHRRDRPEPHHAQRDRDLHRAGRTGDRAPPADPDPHAASRGQAQGHAHLDRRAPPVPDARAGARHGRSRRGAHDRDDSRPRLLGRADALSRRRRSRRSARST